MLKKKTRTTANQNKEEKRQARTITRVMKKRVGEGKQEEYTEKEEEKRD